MRPRITTYAALTLILASVTLRPARSDDKAVASNTAAPTREFEVKGRRSFLDGQPVKLWGLRCGNALYSPTVTDRHINNFNNMTAHGINLIGVSIQGCVGGWPDPDAGLNGFRRDGALKPDVAARLERLVREADKRGMVVGVQILSARKDQDFYDEAAVKRAIEEAGRFLAAKGLRNVFVDLIHTFDHAERIDQPILREPDGIAKRAKMAGWFKAVAPGIEVGACLASKSPASDTFPSMDLKLIQKDAPISSEGFVVNVETLRQDSYENDGWFNDGCREYILADCERFAEAENAAMMLHSAYTQGITSFSGTGPHPEMGGDGTGPGDRGIRFYFDWVREHAGRWEFPRHIKESK
ncbi:hypothetical protein [Singulisphaera sp. PoT]|uniref:hypothetical protein n=1 Tax=Singulisphaera sp. PoT TaxID=3411797 RepID=UPI003BF59721